jgi:hypothetical protein
MAELADENGNGMKVFTEGAMILNDESAGRALQSMASGRTFRV